MKEKELQTIQENECKVIFAEPHNSLPALAIAKKALHHFQKPSSKLPLVR